MNALEYRHKVGLFKEDNQQITAKVELFKNMKVTKLYKFKFTLKKIHNIIFFNILYKINILHNRFYSKIGIK